MIRQGAAQTTYLTFSGPVALPGATLGAGTYVFEVANPSTSSDVIRVSEKAHKTTYFVGFVHRVSRPEAMPADRFVTLGEGRSGGAPRITAWFPLGESFGYRFIYHE